ATHVIILLPAFNDWRSLALLVPQLDEILASHQLTAQLIIVDDASTAEPHSSLLPRRPAAITSLRILPLRRNPGHHRAIAIGLAFIEATCQKHLVVVMDADGEDKPSDVPRLVEKCRAELGVPIVFAERTKRSESLTFRAGYLLYRGLHRILTGHPVRVGN